MIIERHSVVDAPVERVWARVVTPDGINDELRPWMTMSTPRGAKAMTVDTVPDRHSDRACVVAIVRRVALRLRPAQHRRTRTGPRFLEESTMLSMRRWRHERSVTPHAAGSTLVRDRITFQTRAGLRFTAPLIAAGLRAFFGHRHRRLQQHFGSRSD